MPACPDCGLVFDSLYNIQQHRRSGACTQHLLKPLTKPASAPPQSTMYGGGVAGGAATPGGGYLSPFANPLYGAYPMRGHELMAAPPLAAAVNPYLSPSERELEEFLAYQRSRQAADMAERERLMLDQQVNLVLPARQAELQQSQQMLKSQLLQMKLQLFANQQQQEQGANMDMTYLRNEMAAMRGALTSLIPQQPVGGDRQQLQRRRQQQQPQRKAPRRAVSARNLPNRRSPGAYDSPRRQPLRDSYGGEGRRAHTSRWHYANDDCYDDYDDAGGSWSSLDDELRSNDSIDMDEGGVSPHGRRGNYRESASAASPSQQIRGMLQDVQNELRSLRAMSTSSRQGKEVLFPTASTLDPGLHLLKLASLEGIDVSIPLDDVDVMVKVYYMSYTNSEYLLEPSIERNFPRRPAPLVRHDAKTLLFTVPPIEFMVHHPKEMVVFVLQALYRGRLLFWATIFSKNSGTFTEGLRNTTFDLVKALQSPPNMVEGASVSGFIEADSSDSLRRAESFLNQGPGTSAAVGLTSQPAAAASSPHSLAPPPSQPQLQGLPPLPPPPKGLPFLPGMPGCEGPFLPPSADVKAMVLQPNKGPAVHFALPPPTGVSIVKWRENLEKHLKKVQKRPPGSAAGNGAAAVKEAKAAAAAAKKKNTPQRGSSRQSHQQWQQSPPRKAPKPPLPSSSDEEEIEMQPDEDDDEYNNSDSNNNTFDSDSAFSDSVESTDDGDVGAAADPAVRPVTNKMNSTGPATAKHSTAHFADEVVVHTPPQGPVSPLITPVPLTKASPPVLGEMSGESPHSPPHQAYTPPPKRNSNPSPSSLGNQSTSTTATGSATDNPPVAVPSSTSMTGAKQLHISPKNSLTSGDTPMPISSPHNKDVLSFSLSSSQIGSGNNGKVPRDDLPLVERLRLRPIVDSLGNLAVPPAYKINPNNPPSVNLDKFDAIADPPVNPCVLFGLAKPTDKPPASLKPPGHGTKGTTVDVFLDGLTGLPLDAVCTRLVVYVTDEMDPTTGKPINPLHHPRVFMRKPDYVVFQNLTSSSVEPQFSGKFSAEVSDCTFAVVIVEFISQVQDMTLVLGHCCLPINKKFFAGNYVCRIKLGDPRRSQERMVTDIRPADRVVDEQRRATEKYSQMELELSVDSQALHNLLPAPPRKRAECVALGYLIWRLDNTDIKAPFFEMPHQLSMSQAELAVFEGRKQHRDITPTTKGLSTLKAADNAFLDAGATPIDALGNVVPFSEERGAFVKVEGIRGVGDDAAMYIVVVYMPKAPPGRQVCYTMMPDWLSDVGAPMYKDAPFIFTGIKHDMTNTVMYMLLKLTNLSVASESPARVEPLGWSMNKLFLEQPNTMRQGRFALPWIAGSLPPAVVNDLKTQRIEPVYMRMMKSGEMKFLSPPATLIISQGDSACISALVDESPGRGQPRHLLIPAALKKSYPTVTCEGMVGCTLRRAHEKCFGGGDPRAVLQRINAAVQDFLKRTMPIFQQI